MPKKYNIKKYFKKRHIIENVKNKWRFKPLPVLVTTDLIEN